MIPTFSVDSPYNNPSLIASFTPIRKNFLEAGHSMVMRAISGTIHDQNLFMEKAEEYIKAGESTPDLLKMLREAAFGYYVLAPYIRAPQISDIKVYSHDHITVKANGKRYLADTAFPSHGEYERWVRRLLKTHQPRDNMAKALCSFTDRKTSDDFFLRIDIQKASVTSTGIDQLHIRKIPKSKVTWDQLISDGMLSTDQAVWIKEKIEDGCFFLISGKGGSGKTTLLNTMLEEIPQEESVLVVQDHDELSAGAHPQMQFEHIARLQDPSGEILTYDLEDELRMGLLQDIDNFIVGEIRGPEALYVFTTAMSTGARFMGTIHSGSARDAPLRLARLARMSDAGRGYDIETLLSILESLPIVYIHMEGYKVKEMTKFVRQ